MKKLITKTQIKDTLNSITKVKDDFLKAIEILNMNNHIANTIIKQLKKKNKLIIIKKILEISYGYPLLLISFLIPRNKNKIVVGSHTPFNDNSKYFFLFFKKYNNNKRIIWIASTRKIANDIFKLGFESYYRWSLKGLYHSLTAKIYIFSFHIIDINLWTSGNTFKFNLWHGIPLKDIEFNVKKGSSVSIYNTKNIISRIFALYIFIKPDLLLVTGKSLKRYFSKAFRMKDESKIIAFGYPRCDLFFLNKSELNSHIFKYESNLVHLVLELDKFEKTYIYMPTWRDYDFISVMEFDFYKLNNILEKNNSCFLLKLHPATKVNLAELNKFKNIKLLDNNTDVYPLLPYIDCLITDYSSIYFDFILLKAKEIKLFPFDKDKYEIEDRGFIEDYDKVMLSSKYYSFDELLKSFSFKEELTCGDKYKKQINQIWDDYSGNSTENIIYHLNKYVK